MNQQAQDLYQKLSEKYNLPKSVIESIVKHEFSYTKEQLKEGNEVLLHNFGSFEIIVFKLRSRIKYFIKKYREEKTKNIEEDLKKLLKIRNNYAKKRHV